MNMKISVITAGLLLSTSLFGANYATKQDYKNNKWRSSLLKKELNELKKELLKVEKKLGTIENSQKMESSDKNLKEEFDELKSEIEDYDLEEMSDRLDNVETMALKDKISFSIGFKTRVDNYHAKMGDGTKKNDGNQWSEKVYLNMKSKISDNMRFVGRLSMQKNWANSGMHPYSYMDPMQGRTNDSDSKLYVERAYINWVLNPTAYIPVALTIGRQPSSDGPSYNIMDNTTRKSTYSALTFDGAADGFIATFNTNNLVSKSNVKLAYGKGYQHNKDGVDSDLKDTNVYGLLIEKKLPDSVAENSLFQIGYVAITDMIADMSGMMGVNMSNPNTDSIGDMDLFGAMLELQKIKGSKFDAFVHIGFNKVKPNGKVMKIDTNKNNVIDANEQFGLLTNQAGDTETKNGYAFWVGGKYSINKHHQIGLEYNHGSKNWIAMTQGSHDPYNKLAARGDAIEGYYNYIINRNAFIKVGVVNIDYDYSGSAYHIGAPMKISDMPAAYKAQTIKQLIDEYVTLNILF